MVRPLRTVRPRNARLRALGLVVAVLGSVGCGTPAPRPIRPEFDLRHPSATRRVEAVSATMSSRDLSQVPALILLLEDEDDAVRLAAGSTLRELTGHDTGYRAFASPEERARHAELWRTWWAARGGQRGQGAQGGTGGTGAVPPGGVEPPRAPAPRGSP